MNGSGNDLIIWKQRNCSGTQKNKLYKERKFRMRYEICNVHWKSVLFCKYDNATKLRSLCNFRFKFIGRQWNYQKYFVKIPSHACVLVEQTCIPKFHCKRTQLYAILQENIFGIPFLSYKIKFRISGGSELLLWKLYLMVNNFFTVS